MTDRTDATPDGESDLKTRSPEWRAEAERRVGRIRDRYRRKRRFALFVFGGLGVATSFVAVSVLAVLREAEREETCHDNLLQLSLATHFYGDFYDRLPTEPPRPRPGDAPYSWRVILLPFIEQASLFDRYDLSEPWDSPGNRSVAAETPRQYVCLAEGRDEETTTLTSYFAIDGPGTLFERGEQKSLKKIPDSAAATLMYVEAHGRDVVWTEPRDLSPEDIVGSGRLNTLNSRHWNGANVVYADGSVRSLSADVDPVVLKALMTDAGGESVSRPETR